MIFKKCSVGGQVYCDRDDIPSKAHHRIQNSNVGLNDQMELRDMDTSDLLWEEECKRDDKVREFFKHMTLCHSITVDNDSKPKKKGTKGMPSEESCKENEEEELGSNLQ